MAKSGWNTIGLSFICSRAGKGKNSILNVDVGDVHQGVSIINSVNQVHRKSRKKKTQDNELQPKVKKQRVSMKCECKGCIRVWPISDTGKWKVTQNSVEHSHDFTPISLRHEGIYYYFFFFLFSCFLLFILFVFSRLHFSF